MKRIWPFLMIDTVRLESTISHPMLEAPPTDQILIFSSEVSTVVFLGENANTARQQVSIRIGIWDARFCQHVTHTVAVSLLRTFGDGGKGRPLRINLSGQNNGRKTKWQMQCKKQDTIGSAIQYRKTLYGRVIPTITSLIPASKGDCLIFVGSVSPLRLMTISFPCP